ncbi:SPI-2 type III secretion system effector PipB [Salmonella enterica subsp. enterica]|nr:SPI-2 type III secretion system effector PipB [Salmonella enterica subsp. enterica]
MPITNASPENILRYLHAAGTGTKEAMKSATSPRGILEWLVNFFTCGGIRRSNERCFREVIGKLTTSLLYVNKDAFLDGNKIFLEDVNGCTICLSCGAASENTDPMVIIEVNKNGKTVTDNVDSERFWNVCRMLKLMSKHNIQQPDSLITEDGFLNLRGVNLAHKDFQGEDLSKIDASNADFRETNLSNVNLVGAILCCANLHAVNLMGSNMTKANLTHADLTCANMSGVNLTAAILFGSDLTDTKLNGAKLDKIALTLAKSLTGADLTGSQHTPTPLPDYNDKTLFPHPIF